MTDVPVSKGAQNTTEVERVGGGIAAARSFLSPIMRFVRQVDAVSDVLASSDHLRSLDDRLEAALQLVKRSYPDESDDLQHIRALRSIQSLVEKTHEVHALTTAPEDLLDELQSADVSSSEDETTREKEFSSAFESTMKDVDAITGHRSMFFVYFNAWAEVGSRPDRLPMLYSSLLVTCVSTFEMLISNIVRAFYSEHPEALRGSEAKYTLNEIEAFATLDEFRAHCAEKQADGLLYGGLDSWIDWFSRQLKISWSSCCPNLSRLTEIFQRRNVVVHNDGRVNRQYLSKIGRIDKPPAIGLRLTIDREYCEGAIDLLIETGVRIGLAIVRKFVSTPPEEVDPADWYSQSLTFDYLVQNRYKLTSSLAEALLPEIVTERYKIIMMVNRWIALKENLGIESIQAELERWDATILSAEYRLAKLVLTGDIEGAARLAGTLRDSGELSVEDWLTWPLLREVRQFHAAQSAATGSKSGRSSNDNPPTGWPSADSNT